MTISGKKILVVDDDEEVQDILRAILEAEGCQVRICADGQAAEAVVPEFRPDLLVLDVMLPGQDGYTLACRLGASEAGRSLPVIVLSGLEPSGAMFRGLPQVAAFFHKPFPMQEFLAAVRRALLSFTPRGS